MTILRHVSLVIFGAILFSMSVFSCSGEGERGLAASEADIKNAGDGRFPAQEKKLATFAGGCFWCMEKDFEQVPGVTAVVSGYAGGAVVNPSYEQVCAGTTGHTEVIQVHFDSRTVSYADLLQIFWRQINPTDAGGQYVDRGTQYRSEIFYHDKEQQRLATNSKRELVASGRFVKPIVTNITAFKVFYPAEEYHQDFYKKKPKRYKSYRSRSGRDNFLTKTWGKDRVYKIKGSQKLGWDKSFKKPSEAVLKKKLTRVQFEVTQRDGTEAPFKNPFWNSKQKGIYIDVVSGEPLFSSIDKFKSGTGWPSFTKPLEKENIVTKIDHKIGTARTEVRSKHADSHLGHLFKDGPQPTGLRYCINSAALRFIPVEALEREGYKAYLPLFKLKK